RMIPGCQSWRAPRTWAYPECHGLRPSGCLYRQLALNIGLAWQIVGAGNLTIIDKNGGLNNTSTYIGFAPQRKLGVVILVNRGKQHATPIERQILHALAQNQSQASTEGEPNPDD